MPTPITTTTVNFNYKIADTLYSQTDTQGKTKPATYEGPDRIWIFVDEETGKIPAGQAFYTIAEDGDDIPTPPGQLKVEIVAEDNPVIISLVNSRDCTFPGLTNETETLVDGSVITLPQENIYNTYDYSEVHYNSETQKWVTPYRASPINWEGILNARNGMLTASDGKIAPDMPETLKAKWVEYRQKLRDLPDTFGRGTLSETPAWKVALPLPPTE